MVLSSASYLASKSVSSHVYARPNKGQSKLWLYVAILASVLLWASAFPAISVALRAYTPIELACLRYVVASGVLLVYAIVTRMPMPAVGDLPLIGLCGAIGFALYNVMLNVGQQTVPAGVASFVISAEVGVIAVLASMFYRERLGWRGWLGVVLCLAGIGVISLVPERSLTVSVGVLYVFVATHSISFYTVLQKPLLTKYSAIQFTSYAIWAGTSILVCLAPHSLVTATQVPLYPTVAVLYMGMFPGVLAYAAWSYVLSQIPAARAGSYLSLIPVAALLIAWAWVSEVPTLSAVLGGTLVLCGITLVTRRR